jgi:hypothetical protein
VAILVQGDRKKKICIAGCKSRKLKIAAGPDKGPGKVYAPVI